jgi:hypothetical protein
MEQNQQDSLLDSKDCDPAKRSSDTEENVQISKYIYLCPRCGGKTRKKCGWCAACMALRKSGKDGIAVENLSEEDWKFVKAVMHGVGKSKACMMSYGGNEKTANRRGWEVYHKPKIQLALGDLRREIMEDLKISTQRILKERARLAFWNIARYDHIKTVEDLMSLSEDEAAAILEIVISKNGEVKLKLHSKDASLEALEKINGMYEKDNRQRENAPMQIVLFGRKELDLPTQDVLEEGNPQELP